MTTERLRGLRRGLDWLDRRRPGSGLALGLGVGAACGAGAVWLGVPLGVPLGLLGLGGAAALGLTGTAVVVPAPLDEPLQMVELGGGPFWMGSPEGEEGRYPDEGPRHQVRVAPFAMGRFPVTQGLYQQICGDNPGLPQGGDLPVNIVDWLDAVRFCNRLSEHVGLTPCYQVDDEEIRWDRRADGYRLPTEAEWEYAARAGTKTAYSFGKDAKRLGEHAWFDGNSGGQVQPVGKRRPNRWRLHDMHGNVWEWCWDRWVNNYNDIVNHNDIVNVNLDLVSPDIPVCSPVGAVRVIRGGSFFNEPGSLRSAYRNRVVPQDRLLRLGFRCVRGSRLQH